LNARNALDRTLNGLHRRIVTENGTLNGLHRTIQTKNRMLNDLHGRFSGVVVHFRVCTKEKKNISE
jgi:hypothetical protein